MDVTAVAVIIALVEAVKKYVPAVSGLGTVILAAVLGGLAGWFGLDGLNLTTGLLAGLGAVGIHTTVSTIGNK